MSSKSNISSRSLRRRAASPDAKAAYLETRTPAPGRPGVSCLKLPPRRWRPSSFLTGFETKSDCLEEDLSRVRLLERTKHKGAWGNSAHELACRLNASSRRWPWPTLASAGYWRDLRERIVGHASLLLDRTKCEDISFFTIVKSTWAAHPAELADLKPDRLKHELRKNIRDCGVGSNDGWLIGRFEASFDPLALCYQGHFHGIATGDYVAAVNRLKGRPCYRPWAEIPGIPDCKRPIENHQVPSSNALRAFAYSLKSYWELRNAGPAKRLQGDEHTRSLLFLDQRRPEDLFLLMGIHVKEGAFALSA